jgi:hypothetical protein
MSWLQPVVLRGSRASLEPLAHRHADDLIEALHDGELWKLWYTSIPAPNKLVEFIDQRLTAQAKGTLLPFAVIDNTTHKAVGMTNYLNIEPDHRHVGNWRDLVPKKRSADSDKHAVQVFTSGPCFWCVAMHCG